MTTYYTRTVVGMLLVMVALTVAAFAANSFAAAARRRHAELVNAARAEIANRNAQQQKVAKLRQAMGPVRNLTQAWRSGLKLTEKEAAEQIRSEIEAIAQRQLGLVTDNAITPQPEQYLFEGVPTRVQKVTLRASGKDIAALLTWLGKVEERYPAAVVEMCDFSSNVGGNTGLAIRLVQPVQRLGANRSGAVQSVQTMIQSPDVIASLGWDHYTPARLKSSVAVGFQRNPLQPAVAADHQVAVLRDETDEITPRLENALDGRVRSVIRGTTPIVVVDGRVFRIGDELVLGPSREKPVPDAKTKLKQIDDDRLLFHVFGGSTERPLQCDVSYPLPSFLKAR
jgi:hypothetical protein